MSATAVLAAPVSTLPDAWSTARAQFLRVADRLGLDETTRDLLATPVREFQVSIPGQMDAGGTRIFRGYRMQHNDARGPGKGGSASASPPRQTTSGRSPCG